MTNRICSVDGCDRPHHSKGLCRMHRRRQMRTGKIRPKDPARIAKYDGEICAELECEALASKGGYCLRHYKRLYRNGDPSFDRRWVGDFVTYIGAHNRIYRERGLASGYSCIDCAYPASEWSLIQGRGTLTGSHGSIHGLLYSPDPNDYEPRCKPCHAFYDAS